MLGTEIQAATSPLYLPGTMLVATVLVTFFLHRMTVKELGAAALDSAKILLGAGFVLIFTIPMVRVYINSGINPLALPSMPLTMAEWVAANVGAPCGRCLRRPSAPWGRSSAAATPSAT